MFSVKCPKCGENTNIWFAEPVYEGPFRCWKCKSPFLVNIANEALKSCELISEDQFQQYVNRPHSE